MREHLAFVEKIVAGRETFRPKDPPGWFLFSKTLYPLVTTWFQKIRFPDMENSFYADPRCTGCGTCEGVCLSQRIRIENQRPVWQDSVRCMYCFACLHWCPSQAVQIEGRKTMRRGRYHHPAIGTKDIARQKTFEPERRGTQQAADAG
jgi:ferredoxin